MLNLCEKAIVRHHIPVYKCVVHGEGQDEIDQLLLDLSVAFLSFIHLALLLAPKVQRVYRLAIHLVSVSVNMWLQCALLQANVLRCGVYAGTMDEGVGCEGENARRALVRASCFVIECLP